MTGVVAFGVWDAPMTDGAEWAEFPPYNLKCVHCDLYFIDGDNGAILPGQAVHRECHFRMVMGGIGHLVDHDRYCKGPLGTDAGLTTRQSSWLVWRHIAEENPVTPEELETLREIEGRFHGPTNRED